MVLRGVVLLFVGNHSVVAAINNHKKAVEQLVQQPFFIDLLFIICH